MTPGGLLTLRDIARITGVCRQTVSEWASGRRPFHRRLRVLRLGHRTVLVRPADWAKFQEANLQ